MAQSIQIYGENYFEESLLVLLFRFIEDEKKIQNIAIFIPPKIIRTIRLDTVQLLHLHVNIKDAGVWHRSDAAPSSLNSHIELLKPNLEDLTLLLTYAHVSQLCPQPPQLYVSKTGNLFWKWAQAFHWSLCFYWRGRLWQDGQSISGWNSFMAIKFVPSHANVHS